MTTLTRRRARGFGLIEVLISGSLMMIGLAAAVQVISQLSNFYQHQRLVTAGIHLAEGTLEELLAMYSDNPQLGAGPHVGPTYGKDGRKGGGFYTTEWQVTTGVPIAGTRYIAVEVRWNESGRARKIRLKTIRT